MPSTLPTENALGKAVNEFGIGTYDSDNGTSSRGEDDEDPKSENSSHNSLPGTQGTDPFGPDRLLSYPGTFSSSSEMLVDGHRIVTAEEYVEELVGRLKNSNLPGDQDSETTHRRPKTDNIDSVVPSVSKTQLPVGHEPSQRSDYYDHMKIGWTGDEWPDEDSGTYSSEEEDSLPGVEKNEVTVDNFLNSLGNYWSGTVTEDISGPSGFPSKDFSENTDYTRNDFSTNNFMMKVNSMSNHQATDMVLISDLSIDFLKKYGKKDLTRRHVTAFLSGLNKPQYLASDIIRCLKLRNSIIIKDVLDEFPVSKTASSVSLASVRDKMIELEINSILYPEVSSIFRRCAARISDVIADVERFEARNG